MSGLHAHLAFVTKYRRTVFTDAMLISTETTMRGVCADLGAELMEFNGETHHAHLLVAYAPTLAISDLAQRLKERTGHAAGRELTGACVRARTRGHPWPPPYFAVSRGGTPLSIIKHHQRPNPTTMSAELQPPIFEMG